MKFGSPAWARRPPIVGDGNVSIHQPSKAAALQAPIELRVSGVVSLLLAAAIVIGNKLASMFLG
jgi:hypothetical protein